MPRLHYKLCEELYRLRRVKEAHEECLKHIQLLEAQASSSEASLTQQQLEVYVCVGVAVCGPAPLPSSHHGGTHPSHLFVRRVDALDLLASVMELSPDRDMIRVVDHYQQAYKLAQRLHKPSVQVRAPPHPCQLTPRRCAQASHLPDALDRAVCWMAWCRH